MSLIWLLLCREVAAVEAGASVGLGWIEYGSLWTGDPVLGGFDLSSPATPTDRLLLTPKADLTLRWGSSHRLRLRASGRTMQRVTVFDSNLQIVHVWVSDGLPVAEAWRERLFFDEASWRMRPDGDPAIDLRIGVLPFSAAGGRLLAESWPGGRLTIDGARRGWFPATVVSRAAASPGGSTFAALTVQHQPSMFERVGIEIAGTRDPARGIAPLVEDDLSILMGLWRETSSGFIDRYEDSVVQGLYRLYGDEVDGVRALHADLQTFMDLRGTARMRYAAAFCRLLIGDVLLDAALVRGWGTVGLEGSNIPDDALWDDVATADWATRAPRDPFSLSLSTRGWAWDVSAEVTPVGRWRWTVFFQGMTGDPDLVEDALAGETATMFLAPDQTFARTRIFPLDALARDGSVGFPPGVAGHGLISPGTSASRASKGGVATLQAALPIATHPSPLPPGGRIYGLEGDLFVGGRLAEAVLLSAEGGVFAPGPFFLDASDDDRDALGDLPLGWRVWIGVTLSAERGP